MTIDFGWFLPTMGDTDTIGPPTREATADYLVQVAKAAEDAGFVFALVPVGTTCQDAWLAASVVAARTDSLKFLVAMRPGFVAPTVAAKMSNTLDQLTHGRVLINVVTGGFPAELAADGDFVEHDERYARTQEFMQVVRKAWLAEKRFNHEGRFYRVEGGMVLPKPYQQPCPPFYFGGASEAARRVGAEDADVYLLWGETLDMVRERIADMRARAAAIGRTLRFGMRIHVIVRETEEEAWAAADQMIAGIPDNFQDMMDRIMTKSDSEGEKRQRMMAKESEDLVLGPNLWSGIGKARIGVGTALVGSGENVAARLQEYVDEGIDTFILSGYPHLEEAQRFGRYVMPHFEGKRTIPAAPRDAVPA
ncbi:MAG TPA: LLM class flavin-dependent oxidoreductase [Dehalococcoidia bacterium]|nr:LLM class flavin-dependent oxidoreductase [Dehalococcoidia bacterium]